MFDGDLAFGVSPVDDGFGWGRGIAVNGRGGASNITLENNELFNFHRGAVFLGGINGLVIRGNDIHSIRSDGINAVDVNGLLIEENFFHDFKKSEGSADHPDFIQFWLAGGHPDPGNVVIRRNFLLSRTGAFSQSIFLQNGKNVASEGLAWRDVLIEDNLIVNAHTHGITTGAFNGLTIRNNTVLQNLSSARGPTFPPEHTVYEPRIHVNEGSTNVLIDSNIVGTQGFKPIDAGPDHAVTNNLFVQRKYPAGSNYYGNLFINGLADAAGVPDDYRGVPGGLVEQKGVGVRRRLHPPSHLRSRTQP